MTARAALLVVFAVALSACSRQERAGSPDLASLAAVVAAQAAQGGSIVIETETEIILPAGLSTEASAREELLTAYAAAVRASRDLTPVPTPKRQVEKRPTRAPVSNVRPSKMPKAPPSAPEDPEATSKAVRELYLTAYQATFRSAQEAGERRLQTLEKRMEDHRSFIRSWAKRHPEPPTAEAPVAQSTDATSFPEPQASTPAKGE